MPRTSVRLLVETKTRGSSGSTVFVFVPLAPRSARKIIRVACLATGKKNRRTHACCVERAASKRFINHHGVFRRTPRHNYHPRLPPCRIQRGSFVGRQSRLYFVSSFSYLRQSRLFIMNIFATTI